MLREILNTPYKYHKSDWWVLWIYFPVFGGIQILSIVAHIATGKYDRLVLDALFLMIVIAATCMMLLGRNYERKLDDDIRKLLEARDRAIRLAYEESKKGNRK